VGGLKKLKEETSGTILVAGSGMLVSTLLENDLVDELRLMVFPTILGRGKRVFPDGIDRLNFTLTEARTVGPDGVQVQVYERAS
jgi:dihydrofolate reductase